MEFRIPPCDAHFSRIQSIGVDIKASKPILEECHRSIFCGSAVMQRFRHILRNCLILAMIPLTVFCGRVAPGCICSDGHFEPRCGAGNCCSANASQAKTESCHCGKCCQSKQGSAKSCCLHTARPSHIRNSSSPDSPQKCCHPLTLSPMVAEADAALQAHVECPEFSDTFTVAVPSVIVGQVAFVPLVDSGPSRVRLYVLQSLLI